MKLFNNKCGPKCALAQKSLEELTKLVSLGPHIVDLYWGKITDFCKFPWKPQSRVLS